MATSVAVFFLDDEQMEVRKSLSDQEFFEYRINKENNIQFYGYVDDWDTWGDSYRRCSDNQYLFEKYVVAVLQEHEGEKISEIHYPSILARYAWYLEENDNFAHYIKWHDIFRDNADKYLYLEYH